MAITHEVVTQGVIETIADFFGLQESMVKPESTLQSLDMDSMDRLEVLLALEEKFELQITDEEGLKLTSVQGMIDLIVSKN